MAKPHDPRLSSSIQPLIEGEYAILDNKMSWAIEKVTEHKAQGKRVLIYVRDNSTAESFATKVFSCNEVATTCMRAAGALAVDNFNDANHPTDALITTFTARKWASQKFCGACHRGIMLEYPDSFRDYFGAIFCLQSIAQTQAVSWISCYFPQSLDTVRSLAIAQFKALELAADDGNYPEVSSPGLRLICAYHQVATLMGQSNSRYPGPRVHWSHMESQEIKREELFYFAVGQFLVENDNLSKPYGVGKDAESLVQNGWAHLPSKISPGVEIRHHRTGEPLDVCDPQSERRQASGGARDLLPGGLVDRLDPVRDILKAQDMHSLPVLHCQSREPGAHYPNSSTTVNAAATAFLHVPLGINYKYLSSPARVLLKAHRPQPDSTNKLVYNKSRLGANFPVTMEPFPFERLPMELKENVILNLMPGTIVPVISDGLLGPSPKNKLQFKYLAESCPEIRAICNRLRRLVFTDIHNDRELFRLDPLRDTLQVRNMELPPLKRSNAWRPDKIPGRHPEALPVRKLLTVSLRVCEVESELAQAHDASSTRSVYKSLPLETSLPILSALPSAEELTVFIERTGRQWHVDGFQQHGPDIVGIRDGTSWGFSRVGPRDYVAEEFFSSRGIPADTSIDWILPWGRDSISDPDDLVWGPVRFSGPPKIGFHGYSRGTRSLGGQWAGFRCNVATQEVQFRPLHWDEVIRRKEEAGAEGNTTKRTKQPEHHWVDVKEPVEGDPAWVEQVATTWKMYGGSIAGLPPEERDLNQDDGYDPEADLQDCLTVRFETCG
ncbi:hypothetical protein F53441_11700 [Fusarium austroafricanum]|uniref:Uncharacterized protein n=1 Tax=Fusarium austroafricanum TaxID=2364996 RepID=A0A8H4K520_9HYPO|nr:hypothetical protein F53441_11700 [Fusarium austroafricanum]